MRPRPAGGLSLTIQAGDKPASGSGFHILPLAGVNKDRVAEGTRI